MARVDDLFKAFRAGELNQNDLFHALLTDIQSDARFCQQAVAQLDQVQRNIPIPVTDFIELRERVDKAAQLQLARQPSPAAKDPDATSIYSAAGDATLLPATAYSLRKEYARARLMIDSNVAVALATDCNPGSSFTESMPFVIGLAVLNMHMTPAEALTGATLNSAYAINMADRVGSLDSGKQADFLLLEGETPAILAYHAGVSSVARVYKNGREIAS